MSGIFLPLSHREDPVKERYAMAVKEATLILDAAKSKATTVKEFDNAQMVYQHSITNAAKSRDEHLTEIREKFYNQE